MRKSVIILTLLLFYTIMNAQTQGSKQTPVRQFYELRVYHATTDQQLASINQFLESALLPTLHKHGADRIGVFKWTANDTVADKRIYVLIPHRNIEDFVSLKNEVENDPRFTEKGKEFLGAAYDKAPYVRFETILLKAFEEMPTMAMPQLTGPKDQRIYELRSYEGPTDLLFKNKVKMFNQGGEVRLFKRLGFNAVFYAEVLAGSRMPNLMYMTTFENRAAREEHWKTFGNDPTWKLLSGLPEYQHNVSKADILFLTPTDYSDF